MSDEEHHFESKADAGASKTYPQQAGTIRKNGYIVIKGRPCKVVEVSTSKTGKHGHAKCHFVGIDIFTAKKLEDIVPSSHNCDVPHVNRTDYQLIDISEDGFVSLLTENGNTKDDLKLPTDENLLSQIKAGFEEGKDLVVSVMSAMGEEQICALKDIARILNESSFLWHSVVLGREYYSKAYVVELEMETVKIFNDPYLSRPASVRSVSVPRGEVEREKNFISLTGALDAIKIERKFASIDNELITSLSLGMPYAYARDEG
ncbi:eukaryotic translation initiation factor 5A-2 [Olea europaea subsp. europaea]|uniref:Eukaryotic translation initiation factor 5A-2 n=1 Tax=Olea europaea subsp. europaea TaxID=158383 RepID=A0A8S0TNB7_OLEEU|nr:eukaryotic translation initiation factor 5A-2 [Olea europaea subsp. europaea]